MWKKIKDWFKSVEWKAMLLSNAFVYGYPFLVLGVIALATSSIIITITWAIWVAMLIVLTNDL